MIESKKERAKVLTALTAPENKSWSQLFQVFWKNLIKLNKDLLTEVKNQGGVALQIEEMVQVEEKIPIHQAETQKEVMEIKQVPQGKMQAENRVEIIPLLLENPVEIIEIKLGPPVEKVHQEM